MEVVVGQACGLQDPDSWLDPGHGDSRRPSLESAVSNPVFSNKKNPDPKLYTSNEGRYLKFL